MARKVNDEGMRLLKQWEGLVLYAYDDADPTRPRKRIQPGDPVRGTLTIGYGHTRTVRPGMEITEAEADRLFREDLAPCEAAVERAVRVPLTDNQFAALVSFAYNLGHSTAKGSPLANVAETLNKGDYAGAVRRMGLYVKQRQNGRLVTVPGLVNRRAAEAGLWARGEFVSSASVPATAPPPAPEPVADAGKAGGIAAAAAAAAPLITSLAGLPAPVAYALIGGAVFLAAVWMLRRQRVADPAL
jgi:lysozyme